MRSLLSLWLLLLAPLGQAGELPAISTQTLDGREVALPSALPAERTVLLLGFKRSHQSEFDLWRPTLQSESAPDGIDWLELPYVNVGRLLKSIIGTAMDRTITDPVTRAHFAPVWDSPSSVKDAFQIDSDDAMVLVVLGPAGDVIARIDGPPTDAAVARLRAALTAPLPVQNPPEP